MFVLLNSGDRSEGLTVSTISEAGGRMPLSSSVSFEKMSPRLDMFNPRASDASAPTEVLSTTPTGIGFRQNSRQAQPPCPSDPRVVKNIEVLAAFVAKNGPQFEDMTREKQAKNPNLQFLSGGEAGFETNIAHTFYERKKHAIDQVLHSPPSEPVKARERFSRPMSSNDGDHFEQQGQQLHLDSFTPPRTDTWRRTGFDRQSMNDVNTLEDHIRPAQNILSPAVDKAERSLVTDDRDFRISANGSEALEQRKPADVNLHLEGNQPCHRFNDERQGNCQIPHVGSFGHVDASLFQKRNEPTRDAEKSAHTMHVGRPDTRNPVKNAQSGPHTIDEFGRLVRKGVNDIDSDEDDNSFRKRQRSPSGSRSHSPGGSRRRWQSPSSSPRWRGNYHVSYS